MAKKVVVRIPEEPTWQGDYDRLKIIEALNWYNVNKGDNDAAKYLNTKDVNLAKKFSSLAWATRMKSRGCKFPDKENDTILAQKAMFDACIKASVPVATDEPTNVVSIQERMQNKTDAIIGEMEGLIDEFGINGDVADMNAYQWMVDNNVKPAHATKIAEYFRERSKEPMLAAGGKDADLKEAYSVYEKKQLMNLLKVFAAIVSDAEKLGSNAKAARKPRKKKPVSFDKLVKNLKYMTRDDDIKVQSVDPVKIIGSSQLWVYNVKTRKLGVYNALDDSGLSVKGSSITNYASSSVSKTLRKPEKTLKIVTEGGKIALRRALDDVNSKPIKLNGRINKDTILLRIV